MTRIYSYRIKIDSGFAPNPFSSWCTLATCKGPMRKQIGKLRNEIDDIWVVGTGGEKNVGENRLIYAMKVTEILDYTVYWNDPRFVDKRPDSKNSDHRRWMGDNIYEPKSNGTLRQLTSMHAPEDMEKDLNGKFVLISNHFYYFGDQAPEIPPRFQGILPPMRHYKWKFTSELVAEFLEWLERHFELGVHGNPCQPPKLPPGTGKNQCDC